MTIASGSPRPRALLRPRVARLARWLHIYLSMVSFAVVLFFAGTGLTVNHPEWFAKSVTTREKHGTVDPWMLQIGADGAGKERLVGELRSREHLRGSVDEVRVDDSEVSFSYRAPGYSADATVDRPGGAYTVIEVRNGFVAAMNDLHKGRDAGAVWHWVIDLSAGLLVLVSVTGLVLLLLLYKRRTSGLILAAAGCLGCWLLFYLFVP